ncbi:MAG: DUF1559 domain-containing protein [Pirellulaceae bacterium]|nr:DUF1559 domain-containing protein [Pirellulaceae bacterium]
MSIYTRIFTLLFVVSVCLSFSGCGCSESNVSALRRRALKNDPEPEPELAPPAPATPAPATPAPAPQPAPATPQPAPAQPATPATPASPAIPTTPTGPRPVVAAAPEIYPSDSLPKVPTEPLPATSPVTRVITPGPMETLSPLDQRARALDNLRRVGQAIVQHVARRGTLPPVAIRNDRGVATLSWRVAILPELGYDDLYRQFRLFEPWDSPHNEQLLAQIPPELALPGRADTNTNIVALTGPGTGFGVGRGANPKFFEDGPGNTVLVVEADDQQAVPWTKPIDLPLNWRVPRGGLGSLRGDGFFAILGDGRVKRVPAELPDLALVALYSADGGEPLAAADLLKEPTLEPAATVAAAPDPLTELLASAVKPSAPSPSSSIGSGAPTPELNRLPVPDEAALDKSRQLLRDLWGKQVTGARTPLEKSRVANALLVEAARVEANAADYYLLVTIARDMAIGVGDVGTALKAADLVVKKFQIDPVAAELKLLTDLLGNSKGENGVRMQPAVAAALALRARELVRYAYDRDDYTTATAAYGVLAEFIKIKGDQNEIKIAELFRGVIEGAKKAYAVIPDMLKRLEKDPNDAEANELVGKYLCLVKNQWEAGLPLLARGADITYRIVAATDLESVRTAEQTLALADQYWEMAEKAKQPFRRGLHLRAVYCYQVAADQMAGGLEKIRAQKKLDEAVVIYGRDDIQRTLGLAVGGGGGIPAVGAVGVPVPANGPPRGVPVPGT